MFRFLTLRILQQSDDDANIIKGQNHRFLIMRQQSVQKFFSLSGLATSLQNIIVKSFNFILVGGEGEWLLMVSAWS
jgi:hypothetical protein